MKTSYMYTICDRIQHLIIFILKGDVTPPILRFSQSNPSVTNGNLTIQWSFNEEVTQKCTLQSLSESSIVSCNNTWTGENLTEGYYSLYVGGSDLEGNVATPSQFSLTVGMYNFARYFIISF